MTTYVQLTAEDCDAAITHITQEMATYELKSNAYMRLYRLRDSYLSQRFMLMEEENGCTSVSADE